MDLADDIAYSTYDMEDCFASGLLHPLDLFEDTSARADKIVEDVHKSLAKYYYNQAIHDLNMIDINFILAKIFKSYAGLFEYKLDGEHSRNGDDPISGRSDKNYGVQITRMFTSVSTHQASKAIASFKEFRLGLSEQLIQTAIDAVEVDLDANNPELSQVRLKPWKLLEIIVLKAVIYNLITMSPKQITFDRRNRQIIWRVFEFLHDHQEALPYDVQWTIRRAAKESDNHTYSLRQIIADYICGMTEYEIEQLHNQTSGGALPPVNGGNFS